MNNSILDLQPSSIWKYFYQITQIPRPSKHEEKIIDYLVDFAKKHNLEHEVDKTGNVLIRKKAHKDCVNYPIVVLQSHMDMVCEKHSHIEKNFLTDPIDAYVDGDWVKAKGTTLGADNGIGMALQLAILEENSIEHGAIECLFTVDEETGLSGAFGIEPGFLKGNILLNLDSEDDAEFFIGCAGGRDTVGSIDVVYDKLIEPYMFYEISVSGLKGGHSGDDIHKKYGNANHILARFLFMYQDELLIKLSHIDGGNLRNAIPREAIANIAIPKESVSALKEIVSKYEILLKKELFVSDPDVQIKFKEIEISDRIINKEVQNKIINTLYAMPHGVKAWSQDIDNFVETSTNLASVKIKDNKVYITTSQRSSVKTALDNICNKVASVFKLGVWNYEHTEGYPGWTPNPNSRILKIAKKSWIKLFDEAPIQRAIHAGLECGLFSEKYPEMDMISYGPTMRGVHSPDEKLHIPAVQKFWDVTLEILKNVKDY